MDTKEPAEFILEDSWVEGGYHGIPEEHREQWRFGNWVLVKNVTSGTGSWVWVPVRCKIIAS